MAEKKDEEVFINHYEILGIPEATDPKNFRKRWIELVKSSHPDRNLDDPDAHIKFAKLQQSFDIISNPDKRRTFDDLLKKEKARTERATQWKERIQKIDKKKQIQIQKLHEASEKRRRDDLYAKKLITKRREIKKHKEQIIASLKKENIERQKKQREERIKKYKKSSLRIRFQDYVYPEEELDLVFSKYGRILMIVINKKKRKATMAFEDPQSCIMAVNDNEIKEYDFNVQFLGDDVQKQNNKMAKRWKSLRRADITFAQYEAETLTRLTQTNVKPNSNFSTVNSNSGYVDDMDMGDSD